MTLGCLHLASRVDARLIAGKFEKVSPAWIAVAVGAGLVQVPLVALRWRSIVNALASQDFLRPGQAVAITAIGVFLGQVLPNIAGDGIRVWDAEPP